MNEEVGLPNKKKAYEPPKVVVVSLRPEEAVLGNCKSMSSSGPVGSSCAAIGTCRTIGS
jgi:hypothetical protein